MLILHPYKTISLQQQNNSNVTHSFISFSYKKNRSKQWLVKKLPFNYVPLAHSTFILHIYLTFTSVSSGTWTHTVLHYYFLRIACLPISTCLHYYIQKIHYPKNPIRVTPIFLPFYYFPFNPFHHSKIHYQSISFITPLNLPYYLQHKKKTHPNIYIHITLHLLIYS